MQEYKRSLWIMLKDLIVAPLSAAVAAIVLNFFVSDLRIVLGVAALVLLALLYMALISENIRFSLHSEGRLEYYKRGRLRHSFDLTRCLAGYHRRSDAGLLGSHNITLEIVSLENGEESHIDCSPLGLSRFESLYEAVKRHTPEEAEVLRAD